MKSSRRKTSHGSRQRRTGRTEDAAPEFERLTVRQREVLTHALTGATHAAIADCLGLNIATINSHMQSILRRLGLHSRAQLIACYATAISGD